MRCPRQRYISSGTLQLVLPPGDYILAVGGNHTDLTEAVSRSSYSYYGGYLTFSIKGLGGHVGWPASDQPDGWGLKGHYVDLDAVTNEGFDGSYYKIESNTDDDFVIRLEGNQTLVPDDFIGKELIGIHLFDQLTATGGALIDFGDDRVFVRDPENSIWDLDSDIVAGEGSVMPTQQ